MKSPVTDAKKTLVKKLLLLMKLTTVCMLAFVMSVSAKGLGQRKISIQAKNADISTILANIEQKSQYRFLYNTNLPAIKQKATLNVQDTEVREILGMLFKNTGLSFQFMENNLVVIKEGAAAPDEIIIKGKVVNETDGPLAGVSVQVKGGERGTTTNAEGAFTIRVDDANAILVFSYIGYDAKEVPVAGKSEVSVKMQLSTSQLDQVVVVGYGTQRKSQVVGSVAKVSGAEISKQPVLTAAQGLQGKTPGVQIMASGKPGDQPVVRIRGTNSVTGSADPIYVVDGVIMTDITNINSTDIQSVEVLKDASSQAIYGSRAGNGVVLITTKSGKSGRMRVGFDSYVGFKTPTSKVKMADAQTYAAYSNEALAYDGKAALFNLDTITNNTDWFKEITRNGMMQSHNVNLSGGTDKTTYYFSAGYLRDEGILRGNNYTRGVIRLNNEYKVASFLKLGHNLNLNIYKNNNKPNEFSDAYRMAPTSPVKYADGSYGYLSQLSIANPVAALDYTNDFSNGLRLQGNAYAELTPVKGLVIRSSFNFDQYNVDTTNYKPSYFVSDVQQNKTSLLTVANGKSFYYIFDNNATYSYNINKHEFKLTAGYSAERSRLRLSSFNEQNIPNQSNLWYIGQLGDVNTITGTSSGTMVRRASGYSRLGYSFDRRYNFTGVLRRDGSSKFPTGQKWGTFYSVGASWVISQEEFMKNQRVFDNLKARVGYGKVGNDNVSSEVAYLNPVGTTGSYYFGSGTNVGQGITVNQFISPNATWEPTTGFDAGIEFTTLNRRLTGEIGYYYKKTNAYIPVSLTSVTGDKDKIVYDRAADVSNRGVEITLNWQDRVNANFSYHVGANVTFNKNNVERVIGSLQLKAGDLKNGEITTYTVPGSPIGSFWVYQTDGIYRSQAEIDNSPHFDGTQLGDLKYKDVNGDGVLSDADRQLVGSYQPKMYFGFNTGFNYKKFDFSIDCYGNLGNKIYNGKKAIRFGNDNIEMARAENRWSPTNPNGTNPRASNAVPKPSTYYVESGSFFRINNITAGYTIPSSSWHLGISSLRVFVSAQNPIIIKKYSGYTPELPGIATEAGIEYNIYPVTSTYTMGVNLSF